MLILLTAVCAAGCAVFCFVALPGGYRRHRLWLGIAFAATAAAAVVGRVALAQLGHNFDVESYELVAGLMRAGEDVYTSTERYNYGPIWMHILWLLKSVQLWLGLDGPEAFHSLITLFLSAVDCCIAVVLARYYFSLRGAVVFLLCPVSFLITGYHAQFGNLAVLLGLLAWQVIWTRGSTDRGLRWASLLLGLSLVVKHVLVFFPVWLLFWRRLGVLIPRRIAMALAPWAIFGLSLAPWLLDPAAAGAIRDNVLGYSSKYGFALMPALLNLFIPAVAVERSLSWVPLFGGIKLVFFGGTVLMGLILAHKPRKDFILLYLVTLVCLTTSMANQYAALPLVACAYFWRSRLMWMYMLMATLVLLTSGSNVGGITGLRSIGVELQITWWHAQSWLLLFLVVHCWKTGSWQAYVTSLRGAHSRLRRR